jgi:hypothetical protein
MSASAETPHTWDVSVVEPAAGGPAVPSAPAGAVARERFPGHRLGPLLGAGGSANVYRAWSNERQEDVALKVLRRGAEASAVVRERFRREIVAHRSADDPGLVRLLEDGESLDGEPWYTMELVLGGPIQAGGAFTATQRLGQLVVVADTLTRLHRRGVFHRDIKPSNLLVSHTGRPFVADLGIAIGPDEPRLTRAGKAVGTPWYMAPEQAQGEVGDWARVDVYALGLVVREVVMGVAPDRGSQTVPTAHPLRPREARELAWVIRRATHPDPACRYPDMGAFALDLRRCLEGRNVRLRPGSFAWTLRTRLRQRVPTATAALVVVALILLSGLGAWAREAWRQRAAAEAWVVARIELQDRYAESPDGAATWVAAFASEPTRSGTPAVGAAWLDLARLEETAERPREAVAAASRAILATPDRGVRLQGVVALLNAWRARSDAASIELFVHGAPELVALLEPEARREAEREGALGIADLEGAWPWLDEAARALLAPLRRGRWLEPGVMQVVDSDGDGRLEEIRIETVPAPVREGEVWRVPRFNELSPPFIHSDKGQTWRLGAAGPIALPGPSLGAAVGDAYWHDLGGVRQLGLSRPSGDRAWDQPLMGNPGASAVEDMDGDGVAEVVFAIGPSWGFQPVVVFPDGEGFRTVSGPRVGWLQALAPVGPGRVAGVATRRFGSRLIFGRKDSYGGPCRLVVFRYSAGALSVEQELPWGGGACPDLLESFDLDHDGVRELIASGEGQPALFLSEGAGEGFQVRAQLSGYRVRTSPSQSAVGRTESAALVLQDAEGRLFLPGEGGDVLPALPRRGGSGGGDPESDLFEVISPDTAVDTLLQRSSGSPEAYAQALDRAAALWEREGQRSLAVRLLLRRAQLGGEGREAALRRAARLAQAAGDLEQAAEAVEALGAVAGVEGEAVRRATEGALRVQFGGPLPTGVDLRVPVAVIQDPSRGALRLRVPSDAGVVLRLPLRTTGAPLWLRAKGEVEVVEWASTARILMRGIDEYWQIELWARGLGSGGILNRELRASARGGGCGGWQATLSSRVDLDFDHAPFDLRWGAPTADQQTIGFGRGLAGPPPADCTLPLSVGQRAELVIEGMASWGHNAGMLVEMTLEELELHGVVIDTAAEPEPLDRLLRFTRGERGALTELSAEAAPGEIADLYRAAALSRLDPGLYDDLREAFGEPTAAQVFAITYRSAWTWNMDRTDVISALLNPPDLRFVEPGEALGLEAARGEALLLRGRVPAGRALLRSVADRAGGGAWLGGVQASLLLADLARTEGDLAAEAEALARAAELSPDRDLLDRMFRARREGGGSAATGR